jgi:hypothetical protein
LSAAEAAAHSEDASSRAASSGRRKGGNGGGALFLDDTDRRRFLGLVAELPERFSLEVHAFVLMGNHYHLLLRCLEANLSEAIRWLRVSYAGRFNWAHRRRGHVFQGRFKSVVLLEGVRQNSDRRGILPVFLMQSV